MSDLHSGLTVPKNALLVLVTAMLILALFRGDTAASIPTVVVDAVSAGTTSDSSLTFSHTSSGSNRLMLVGVSINNDNLETVSSVTYNGMTAQSLGSVDHQGSRGDDARVEIWGLVEPAQGSHDVVVTFSASLRRYAVVGVVTFTGVNQIDPVGAFVPTYGDTSSPALTVPSAPNELVVGVVACETCNSVSFVSPAAERWNIVAGGGNTIGAGATAEAVGPQTVLNVSLGQSDHWAMGAISIKPK